MIRRKLSSAMAIALAAMLTLGGAVAFACTNLATLNLSSATGSAGDELTVTGSSFRTPRGDAPVIPVQLHWNGDTGPMLAEVSPDSTGAISADIAIPDSQPGYYVIVATQRDAEGVDQYGTPARASFQILGADGNAAATQASTQGASPVSTGAPAGLIALTIVLGIVGLGLFGAGIGAVGRQLRGERQRTPERVKND